ncbi:MAG: hypothetical protein B7Z15_23985, partial [Rhizobiales bacterium 32-66-8]
MRAGGGAWGGGGTYTGSDKAPAPLRADPGVYGGGKAGIGFAGQPKADTGSLAQGGLSFAPETGMGGFTRYEAQYGLQDRFDPAQATDAAARLAADNAAHLRKVLGRDPTAAELYLAHQQGAGGAARLLANPDAPAASIVGADAVRLNGGDLNMTAGQFASKWTGKFGGGGGGTGGGAPAAADPLSDPYVQRLMQ